MTAGKRPKTAPRYQTFKRFDNAWLVYRAGHSFMCVCYDRATARLVARALNATKGPR